MAKPFRFGVQVVGAGSGTEFVEKARRAEELGYAVLTMPDHFGRQLAPMTALAAAAIATTSIRLGTLVAAVDYRHPVMLAKQAATLDVLSGGRFELGIGAGWHRQEYEQAGIPFAEPGVRVGRLKEAVQVLKALFSDEPAGFSGEHYTVSGLDGQPKPVQRPHPPFLIAGGGKRILGIAAREADTVGLAGRRRRDGRTDLSSDTAEGTAQKIEWVREAAGDRFEALELNILVGALVITDDRRKAAEDLMERYRAAEFGIGREQVLQVPRLLVGTSDQIVEDLQARRKRYGISYITVVEEHMDALAPIVQRLTGR